MRAWIVCCAALWTACQAPSTAATRQSVVYGEDGRTEVYAHPNAALRTVAERAIAIKVGADLIDASNASDVRFDYTRTLAEAKDLCDGERFADQIEPGTCSGTLIDDRHLLTAGHCMDAAEDCTDDVWVFGFRYISESTLATLTSDDVYRCARVLAYADDGDVDHAIVELDRPVVGHPPPTLRLSAAGLPLGTPLALIGHPNGIPMKIDDGGTITWSSGDGSHLTATLDAFNGNSGSGVFDHSGTLVALLHGGEDDYVDAGGCNEVNVIDPPPTDDGEGLTYITPAIRALCAVAGVESPTCDCDGPCVPAPDGDACSTAEQLEARTQTVTGTLVGFSPSTQGSCGGEGPERVYTFDVNERVNLTARSSGFDTLLHLRRGCEGPELACEDDIDPDRDRGSRLRAALDPGTYHLFMDAYDSDVGEFTLALTFTEPPPPATDAGAPPASEDAGAEGDDGGPSALRDAGSPSTPVASDCTCRTGAAPGGEPVFLSGLATGIVGLLLFRRRRRSPPRASRANASG